MLNLNRIFLMNILCLKGPFHWQNALNIGFHSWRKRCGHFVFALFVHLNVKTLNKQQTADLAKRFCKARIYTLYTNKMFKYSVWKSSLLNLFSVCAHEMHLPEPAPKTKWQNQMHVDFSSTSLHYQRWSKSWNFLMEDEFA